MGFVPVCYRNGFLSCSLWVVALTSNVPMAYQRIVNARECVRQRVITINNKGETLMRISFYDYMVDNYLEDDSKYSDLAEDMEMDLEIDEQETDVEKLRGYFKSKIEKDYIMKVVEDCLEAYENDRWI